VYYKLSLVLFPYSSYTDLQLITLLKKDDVEAYTEIYNRYSGLLQNHALKKTGDFDEVNDILQDVFTNLWLKRHEIASSVNLAGYLYIAVRNRLFNILAHTKIKNNYILQSLEDFMVKDTYQADSLIREKELAEIIDQEINALPLKMREVFILRRMEYLSHLEIAERLNISQQTVAKQVSNALKILRVKLNRFILIFFFF